MSQDLRSRTGAEADESAPEPEHRGPRMPPIAYPIIAFALGTALVWSFSRILLAVTETDVDIGITVTGKTAAALIALLVSINILIGAALVAYGRRVRRRPASLPVLLGAGLVLIGAGAAANTVIGQEEGSGGEEAAQIVTLVSRDVKFDTSEITVHAGGKVEIQLQNQDAGVPHNVAVYTDDTATQPLFQGPVITGPATTTYSFATPPPGAYFFRCDVHPVDMVGTFRVTAGGQPPPGGGGGPPGAPAIVAESIAFNPTELTVTPAGGMVTIHFDNRDAAVPHNVAVFDGSDPSAEVLFRGEIITGPAAVDYAFEAPPPGTYYFHCDVHPQMQGMLTIG